MKAKQIQMYIFMQSFVVRTICILYYLTRQKIIMELLLRRTLVHFVDCSTLLFNPKKILVNNFSSFYKIKSVIWELVTI